MNLILGYNDSIPSWEADQVPNPVMQRFWGELYHDVHTIWSAYILGNQEEDVYEWEINGHKKHRYDYIHGASVPSGKTNNEIRRMLIGRELFEETLASIFHQAP